MRSTHRFHNDAGLFTETGERKYLNAAERQRFYEALACVDHPAERTFCKLIFWTGCRISEALQMTGGHVDIDAGTVVIRSLKKHGRLKGRHFRVLHVPRYLVKELAAVHGLGCLSSGLHSRTSRRLWNFTRQRGWKLIKRVMRRAGIDGSRATARGLRHGFGVHAILSGVPQTTLQRWLGHASLETTGIYVAVMGTEERHLARRMWA